jgi:hypothetical protein
MNPAKAMNEAAKQYISNRNKAKKIEDEYKRRYCVAFSHYQMSDVFFKKHYPNGIFCKVMGFDINKGFHLRCWSKKSGHLEKYHSYRLPKHLKWL